MSTYRSRRAIPSAINTPITVRVHKVNSTTGSEAERILTSFIDASEINISGKGTAETNATGISGGNESPAIVSQLKRIQRSLRGLPPLMSEEQFSKSNASLEDAERPNKKIKFDESDDSLSSEKVTEAGVEEEDKSNEGIEEVVSEDEKVEHKKEKKSKKDKSSKEKDEKKHKKKHKHKEE
ncbi:DNA-directed RNA polymerase I subunit, putative [Candida dubliniensis CD36]|uniref:DNA-directed RNA polymerase I subunit, putative n=1 Tax=Candida dubliniensis (strain CD36 / ATCC MYA-646 / CBS 7987 / NCPF 3949 / NRRL Y-17841) TaxID=573826 RepID=B9WGX7_CANDC|nr:DNA-directed RNA polymerase I subunit, putative [Candida dubliniensis CD36]CAX41415.1 DNA-directed RNA polymerase I subunit, putative [Candida dubliniensis CD36]